MSEREYYRRMVLLPAFLPPVAGFTLWFITREGGGGSPELARLVSDFLYYAVIGALPYAGTAMIGLVVVAQRTPEESRRFAWTAPLLFTAGFVFLAALFSVPGESAREKFQGAVTHHALPCLLAAYAYVAAVQWIRPLVTADESGDPPRFPT